MKKIICLLFICSNVVAVEITNSTESAYRAESAPGINRSNSNYNTHKVNPHAVKNPQYTDYNVNDNYIKEQTYLQNPFRGLAAGGGTQYVTHEQKESQNFAERVFADGTWDVYGFYGMQQNSGKPLSYNLSSTIFGQTGSVGGFSLGGAFIVANPFIQNTQTTSGYQPYVFMTSEQYNTPTEAFVEYQYSNILLADVGYIGINNSPFLAASYYSDQSSGVNYQGALFNINPGKGWLIIALAFNGALYPGNQGFTGATLYDSGSVQGIPTGFPNASSNGTVAIGASYYTPGNLYDFRVWGYQFNNYASLVYGDTTIKLPVDNSNNLYFTLSAQGGFERGNQTNAINSAGLGNINSNFAGAQAGFNYNWFNLTAGYENVWGPDDAFGHGAIVSPYTYNENVDPMYGNSWMTGLTQKTSSGQMFIVTPSFYFFDHSLSLAPAYSQVYSTVAGIPDQEFDFVVNYFVPSVKGLKFFGVYAYMVQQNQFTTYQGQQLKGGDVWTALFMTEYLY